MRRDRIHQITIIRKPDTTNDFGHPTGEWPSVVTCWASYEPLLGSQYFAAEQMQSGVKVKFETEYVPGITRAMRVVHDNKKYDIIDPINVKGLSRDLLLYCKEVVS